VFDKILIANRGEIACRIVRTARALGVRTVAVYSDADAGALHVALADEAYRIGPAPAAESYLKGEVIVEIAKRSGAQAIHPGYGFLSERASFAELCDQAGIAFIGPPAKAIEAMGSKSGAKAIMAKAKVPIVPGYYGSNQDAAHLKAEAEKIGYPVLIKASAGGGGKGMRLVEKGAAFADALASAKREAKNSFGDDEVLIEKFVTQPRHIEIQVFADTQGNAVYLFERDCSVQRRHQKVLEEAPAPGMTEARRKSMGEAAVAAAKAIGYVGAGTVEFIAGSGEFYFMEMNTRLQVEHPVTELISGQDLVEWQLRVASGERLPKLQSELSIHGHAIEARLYAEDPTRDFLPATGRLSHLHFPASAPTGPVRVDTGVRAGDEVSIFYDPMIAKLIAWAPDRAAALKRMAVALGECEIAGLVTNVEFLRRVVEHPDFAAGKFDTGFIARHKDALVPPRAAASDTALALAALAVELRRAQAAAATAARSSDPFSPWHTSVGWRLNDAGYHTLNFQDGERKVALRVHYTGGAFMLDLPGGALAASGEMSDDGTLDATVGDRHMVARVAIDGDSIAVFEGGIRTELDYIDPLHSIGDVEAEQGNLRAPMSGKIIEVMVKDGARVKRGTTLLILEAMKMEHNIAAPADGTVKAVHFGKGEQVAEGAQLIEFEADEKA